MKSVFLLDACIQYKDAILEEVVFFHELNQELIKLKEHENIQKMSNVDKEIEDIVKQAKKEKKDNIALLEQSNTKKLRSIKNNRLIEKEVNKENEKFELDKQEKVQQITDLRDLENTSNKNSIATQKLLEKIRQKGNERLGRKKQ